MRRSSINNIIVASAKQLFKSIRCTLQPPKYLIQLTLISALLISKMWGGHYLQAVEDGDTSKVQSYLAQEGADPNYLPDNKRDSGKTALHYACHSRKIDTVIAILSHPAISPNIQDSYSSGGRTALQCAAAAGFTDGVIAILCNATTNPNLHQEISQRNTSLTDAAWGGAC